MPFNNLKPNVLVFYKKGDYTNVYGLDEVHDGEFICAVCYDMVQREIRAGPVNRTSLKYGRHFPNQEMECTKIFRAVTEKNTEYIEKFDVGKVMCAVRQAIETNQFEYWHTGECCMLNPNLYDKEKSKYIGKFRGECNIEATKDYLHIRDDEKSVVFLFDTRFQVEGQHLILNTSKYLFMQDVMSQVFRLICTLSSQNNIKLCDKCYDYNSEFLRANKVPEKYDDPTIVCPVKSNFLKCFEIKQPEKIAEILTLHKHPTIYTTDYDLVYNLPFCYEVTHQKRYDFYTCVFLLILKQKGYNGDNYKEVLNVIITRGLEHFFKNPTIGQVTYVCLATLYEETLKPILEPPPPPPPPPPATTTTEPPPRVRPLRSCSPTHENIQGFHVPIMVYCKEQGCNNKHKKGYLMCFPCKNALTFPCPTDGCKGSFTNKKYETCYRCFLNKDTI